MIRESIDLIGMQVRDKITGMTVIVISTIFDLPGCIQCVASPPKKDQSSASPLEFMSRVRTTYFDVNRLEPIKRIMPAPKVADIDAALATLGRIGTDKVTGITGVIGCICVEIDGGITYILNPGVDESGAQKDQHKFNRVRIDVSIDPPVMEPLDFDATAAAIKQIKADAKAKVAEKPSEHAHGPMDKSNIICH